MTPFTRPPPPPPPAPPPPAEYVIRAAILSRPLDRGDVARLLHHADDRRVAPRIAAHRAHRLPPEGGAPLARTHALGQRRERLREPAALLRRLFQQVVRQSQRRLPPDRRG